MHTPTEIIKRSCLDLAVEETCRTLCPFCGGGKHAERTLSCRRTQAGILYNCKRGSCGKSGIIGGTAGPYSAAKRKEKIRAYQGPLTELPKDVWESKFQPYEISYETVAAEGIKYASEVNRIYFPVYDYRHYQIGELLRAVTNEQKPKVLTNKFSPEVPFIHLPLRAEVGEELVLVEDMISAIKVSHVTPAMALMGTQLSEESIDQFLQIGVKEIILMLDGDDAGLHASLRLKAHLSPFFRTHIRRPPKNQDPKHLSYDLIASTLS